MISKLEAGTTLYRMIMDVDVANKIFMDNAPEQTGYNTEMQRVARLTRMEFQTTEPYSTLQNKAESINKIIKGKARRRRVQRNITKRVREFGMVWKADIYYRTAGKDGHPDLERSTGDKIDISEWLEFEFYDLVWFWNNQSDNTAGTTNPRGTQKPDNPLKVIRNPMPQYPDNTLKGIRELVQNGTRSQ